MRQNRIQVAFLGDRGPDVRFFARATLALLVVAMVCAYFFVPSARAQETTKHLALVQPRLNSVFPMAAQPGTNLCVDLRGEFLDRASLVRFESSDLSGKVLASTFTSTRIEIKIDKQAEAGARFFRLVTARGVSNLALFRVTRWPAVTETEPNDELDRPTVVSIPSLISARLSSVSDVDLYRFHARAGQRIQFNLLGARNWTFADTSLAILYPSGREIVHDEGRFIWDPYIDHVFHQEGDYVAAVTATRMPAGGQARNDLTYQLAIGQSPFIWSLFPFGGTRGTSLDISMHADFLQPAPAVMFNSRGIAGRLVAPRAGMRGRPDRLLAEIAPAADSGVHDLILKENSGTFAPAKFIVGEFPEIGETEPNDSLRQAQPISVPTTVNGRIDKDGDEDWYKVSVEAGESLTFIIDAEKYGSALDSQLTLVDAKGKTMGANDDAKMLGRALNRDSLLHYKFKDRGNYFIKVSSVYRTGGQDHVYRLTARRPRPGFSLALDSDRVAVARNGTGKVGCSVLREEGFKGEITIRAAAGSAGVTAEPLVIAADKDNGTLEFAASAEAPPDVTEIVVYGIAKSGGTELRQTAHLPESRFAGSGPGFLDYKSPKALLAVVEVPLFSIESAAATVYLVRGGSVEFGVKISRAQNFLAPLEIAMENLPSGINIEKVEFIDQGRMARVTLKAADSVSQARISDLTIIAKASDGSEWHSESAPRIMLQVD
ncbi:MAG TPA: PPC domain-containing protein [Acidobacteriota bacterium]|nr:PPC domain-containing protein [Acidobacteriota bacterium]